MKIAFFLGHVGIFRHFEGAIRHLCNSGHEVKLAICSNRIKNNDTDRALLAFLAETKSCEVEYVARQRRNFSLPTGLRELINYANYLRPQHPSPVRVKNWAKYFPKPLRPIISSSLVHSLLRQEKVWNYLRRAEDYIAPAGGRSDGCVRISLTLWSHHHLSSDSQWS